MNQPSHEHWERRGPWMNIGNSGNIWMRHYDRGNGRVVLHPRSHYSIVVVKEGFRARAPYKPKTKYYNLDKAMAATDVLAIEKGVHHD